VFAFRNRCSRPQAVSEDTDSDDESFHSSPTPNTLPLNQEIQENFANNNDVFMDDMEVGTTEIIVFNDPNIPIIVNRDKFNLRYFKLCFFCRKV